MNDYSFYKVNEVSEILKINPVTVRRWCQNGFLRAKKIGKSWYISRDDLDVLTDTGKTDVLIGENSNCK